MNPTFIAIDTETTGLDPVRGALLEVGWQVVLEGQIVSPPTSFFVHLPEGVEERYRRSDDENKTSNEVFARRHAGEGSFHYVEEVFAYLRRDAANLSVRPGICFHNAPFDMAFIVAGLERRMGAEPYPEDFEWGEVFSAAFFFEEARGPFSRRILDTQTIALYHHMRGRPGYESCSLAKLCAHFGIVNEAPHTAGGDARATAKLALAMLREGL